MQNDKMKMKPQKMEEDSRRERRRRRISNESTTMHL